VELDAEAIRMLLDELAEELPQNSGPKIVVIAGGAMLSLCGFRTSTTDIDSITGLSVEMRAAAEVVAQRHDLDGGWLNDRAVAFIPMTFRLETCELLLDHPQLRVFGASMRDLFLMKLYAARDPDIDDLEMIWPHTDFSSAQEVVAALRAAYPSEPDDEYLVDFVQTIVRRSESR
jgi:hypothetical protein